MRSYVLAVAVAMLLSAVYAFQNTAEITVRFLMLERKLPQGVWEVIIFSVGAFLMWLFSIIASLEIRSRNNRQIKERDKRIAELEEEKKSLLTAFNHIAPTAASPAMADEVVILDATPTKKPETGGAEAQPVAADAPDVRKDDAAVETDVLAESEEGESQKSHNEKKESPSV